MNKRHILLSTIAGALGSLGSLMLPTKDYNQRPVRVLGYKTGGRPFTKGKRSKSLKTRANRLKAKTKH